MGRSSYVTLIVATATSAALATAVAIVAAQPPAAPLRGQGSGVGGQAEFHAPELQGSEQTRNKFEADLVGVGSCAASGCHGGARPNPGALPTEHNAWRTSYMVWAAADPHARAYRTLTSPKAISIVRKLDGLSESRDAPKIEPQHDARCVTCHATGYPSAKESSNGESIQHSAALDSKLRAIASDGVSCESCHGPARQWLGEHFLIRADSPTPVPVEDIANEKARLAKLGMVDTSDVVVQAQTCVRCHVGERNSADPHDVRDMNHDMIAAGHPALSFEFAAYKAMLPKHWSSPRTPELRAGEERLNWTVGQLISAAAALRLSAARAEASLTELPAAGMKTTPHAPWPEFSEFACYRCHHALRSGDDDRPTAQQRLALDRKTASAAPLEKQLWGTWGAWHTSQALGKGNPAAAELAKVVERASHPFASDDDRKQLITAMRECAAKLDAAAFLLPYEGFDDARAALKKQLAEVAESAATKAFSWDEATQAYLGCVALYRARRAADELPLNQADDAEGNILLAIYQALRFDRPTDRAFNSPANFDQAGIKQLFADLAAAARKEG